MIINKIKLTNIGPFKGDVTLDLRTDSKRNTILIGGENGAGKTTLLNAIKIGLFGPFSYGYKTENNDYYARINHLLNNDAKKDTKSHFMIQLSFTQTNDFEKVHYLLERAWTISKKGLNESYSLFANEEELHGQKKEIFQSKLIEAMPPQLLDLCLFDGEEISHIVNNDMLSSYLEKLSRVVFNLDLFETLENDLLEYTNQIFDPSKMEVLEKDVYQLNKKDRDLKEKIALTNNKIHYLKNKKLELRDEYERLRLDFENYGGLIKRERDELNKKIKTIDDIRKRNLATIREFVAELLPFYLSKELLLETRNQIQEEEKLQLYNLLYNRLTDKQMNKVLTSVSNSLDETQAKMIKEKVLDLIKPTKDIHTIHEASFSEASLMENMCISVSSQRAQNIINLIDENRIRLNQQQALREKLKINDSSNEFSEMIQQMEQLQQTIMQLEHDIPTLLSQLDQLKNELELNNNAINKIESQLRSSKKTQSSFLESQKIISLSKRFREIQLKKKLHSVEREASSILRKLLRKHGYIHSIVIDHEDYGIYLLDSLKNKLEVAILSAGEKQILLISVIWAIFKCSGKKVPFIFDTLLGRLDQSHRESLLKEFIPNCGEQVIILATNTEVDQAHYEMLNEYTAKEYMLDFNVEERQTKVKNHYFPFDLYWS